MRYIIGVVVVLGLTVATTVGSDFYAMLNDANVWVESCGGNC